MFAGMVEGSEGRVRAKKKMKLLSVEEVAEALGVSRQTVSRMIAEGSLPAICLRSGRRKKVLRIRPEALDRWLAAKERETSTSPSKFFTRN
jgi:excisionase family DNA binding protein